MQRSLWPRALESHWQMQRDVLDHRSSVVSLLDSLLPIVFVLVFLIAFVSFGLVCVFEERNFLSTFLQLACALNLTLHSWNPSAKYNHGHEETLQNAKQEPFLASDTRCPPSQAAAVLPDALGRSRSSLLRCVVAAVFWLGIFVLSLVDDWSPFAHTIFCTPGNPKTRKCQGQLSPKQLNQSNKPKSNPKIPD